MRLNNTVLQFDEALGNHSAGLKLVYGDFSQYDDDFKSAMDFIKVGEYDNARHHFQLAYESVSQQDIYHNKYASYCGLLRLLSGDRSGIDLCRDVARNEYNDGDVFLNLARAEWFLRERKSTVLALKKGLSIDQSHPGIAKMRKDIGLREKQPISFLKRDNILNKTLGKMFRSSASFR
ncbi:MAG: hypothetical protein QM500_12460 [Methylococcales bacterium]